MLVSSLARRFWQKENLRIYIIIRFPYFSCPHGLHGRPPRKRSSRQQPAHVSRRPPCSHLARHAPRCIQHCDRGTLQKAPHEPLFRRAIVQNEAREIARHTVDELDPPRLPIRTQDCATSSTCAQASERPQNKHDQILAETSDQGAEAELELHLATPVQTASRNTAYSSSTKSRRDGPRKGILK